MTQILSDLATIGKLIDLVNHLGELPKGLLYAWASVW